MLTLEQRVEQNNRRCLEGHLNFLQIDKYTAERLYSTIPKAYVSDKFDGIAALSISDDGVSRYIYNPNYVSIPLVDAEESSHYLSSALNPLMKTRLLRAEKGGEEFVRLMAREEYIGRLLALVHLDEKGIQIPEEKLAMECETHMIVMRTSRADDALAHYIGYKMAEEDFATLTKDEIRKKLLKVIFSNDLSEFEIPEVKMYRTSDGIAIKPQPTYVM
jgi:hypothetical protein